MAQNEPLTVGISILSHTPGNFLVKERFWRQSWTLFLYWGDSSESSGGKPVKINELNQILVPSSVFLSVGSVIPKAIFAWILNSSFFLSEQ